MAINEELGFEIEKLSGEGLSYREIAKRLNLSKSYVANYLAGKVKIIKKCPQNVPELSTAQNYDINNLKSEMKEYIDRQLENYSISITKDDLEDFRKDIINQARKDIYRIEKQIEQIERRIRNLEQTDKQESQNI